MIRILIVMLSVLVSIGALNSLKNVHAAEEYPVKPIIFIVANEAGSDADIISRAVALRASQMLGKPIVIVNKTGASGFIGYSEIHDAKPDGYTIGWGGVPLIIGKLQGILPWDHHGFTPIGAYYTTSLNVFASTRTKRPFKSIEEAISFAKSNPEEVSMVTGGKGMNSWIGAMAFQEAAGIKFNIIPQVGGGNFIATQLAGGHADLGVILLPSIKPQIDAGNIRFLAVIGSERDPSYKDVPTLKELGYDVEFEACGFVMGPPKMPKNISDKLAEAFRIAVNDPEYEKFVIGRFVRPLYLPPDKILPYFDKRRDEVRSMMEKAGILKKK